MFGKDEEDSGNTLSFGFGPDPGPEWGQFQIVFNLIRLGPVLLPLVSVSICVLPKWI